MNNVSFNDIREVMREMKERNPDAWESAERDIRSILSDEIMKEINREVVRTINASQP